MAKKLLIIGASILGLLVVTVLGLALLLDANQFRPTLEDTMSRALGRRVTISKISVAPFSGGIAIRGFGHCRTTRLSVASRSSGPKAVTVGVDLMPLDSVSGAFASNRSDSRSPTSCCCAPRPARGMSQVWLPRLRAPPTAARAVSVTVFIQTIKISNGRIVVANVAKDRVEHIYDDVNLEVSNVSLPHQLPSTRPPGRRAAARQTSMVRRGRSMRGRNRNAVPRASQPQTSGRGSDWIR